MEPIAGTAGYASGFLAGGGRMGALIRAKDWAATPLGPADNWSQSLRTSVSICLNCSFPILIWWGPAFVKIYNDAYADVLAAKHPAALGMPGMQVWPEIWDTIGPMLSRVMDQGEATAADDLQLFVNRHGYSEECYFSFSYSPIRDETGRVVGVFCPVVETTRRVLGERLARFLLALEAGLRELSNPKAVKAMSSRMLGEYLGVSQAGYAEAMEDGAHVTVEGEWNDGRMPSTDGVHRLADYGPLLIDDLLRGSPICIDDVAADLRTRARGILETYQARSIGALLSVPLLKNGTLKAVCFVHQAGSRTWSEHEIAAVRDVAERTWSAVERAVVEAALRRSEEDFRALGENLPSLCWMADADGWLYWYNRTWYTYTGATPAEMEGWGWQSVHHPEFLPAVLERWTRCVKAGEPFDMTFPLRGADGTFRTFLTRVVPLRDADGTIVRWFGNNVDISEQQRVEQALRDSQVRLQAIFDTVPVSITFAEAPSGRLVFGNAAVDRIFRYPMRYSDGVADYQEWEAYDAEGGRVKAEDFPMVIALQSGQPAHGEFQFLCGDGVLRWIGVTSAPLRDSTGRVTGAVAVCADIDDIRRAEIVLSRDKQELERLVAERTRALEASQAQLAHAQRMEALGQLAGGIAHDFNNVVQAVQAGARLIERRPRDAEKIRSLAVMIAESAARGAAITRRLLTFSRRGDLRAEPVDAAPLLSDMKEILAHTLGSAITVRVETEDKLPPLLADKGQLETVLVNLATNARDAIPNAGVLTLAAALEVLAPGSDGGPPINVPDGSYIRLSVIDTGSGMMPEVLARASEPFFTTKEVGKGTGLGLAMARGFAEQSGGGLHIQSAFGRGTVVTLWFPVALRTIRAEAVSSHAMAKVAHPGPARARLLIVDDERIVRETLSEQMEDEGFRVMLAEGGAEALCLLDAGEAFDLVVADLSMPGMDGLTLIRELQRRRPGLPAILLTGFATDAAELALSGALSGRFTLLRKPIEGGLLGERAAVMLEQSAAEFVERGGEQP